MPYSAGRCAVRDAPRRQGMRALDVALALVVTAIAAVAPLGYSNELLLFNFVTFLALSQGLNVLYGFTGYLPNPVAG